MKLLKEAARLNDNYKAISLDIFDIQNDEERIIDEIKFQLDNLKFDRLVDEELEEQGYTEGQIKPMKNNGIKQLEKLLENYNS